MNNFVKLLLFHASVFLATYLGLQYYLNKDAIFRVGDCFISKSLQSLMGIQINNIRNGKYYYTLQFIIAQMEREDEIKKFEDVVTKNFDKVDCETGKKL